MVRGAHWVYDVTGAEMIVKDVLGVGAFHYGEVVQMTAATSDGCAIPAANTGKVVGVSNEAQTTDGTVAAGTLDRVKVIINPFGVYRIPYDQGTTASTTGKITWGTVTDTTIPFTCASSVGYENFGGGWCWSYDTGKLDFVVSSTSGAGTTCTMTTVTGTTTTSDYGILIQPIGYTDSTTDDSSTTVVELNAGASSEIDADQVDQGVPGTNGYAVVNLMNWIRTSTYGMEMLLPQTMNQATRYMYSQTGTGKNTDKGEAYSDICFFPSSIYLGNIAVT